MRAAINPESGDPADVEVTELPDPEPEPGEALVRVEACSLNHRDLWRLKRGEESEDGPFVGGADVAGTVERAPGDAPVAAGDRVVLFPLETCGTCRHCREGPENLCVDYGSYDGGFAELCTANADRLVPIPGGLSFVEAAALPIAYLTAWEMLDRGGVTAGDRVLVPGATGGVGVAAVQLAGLRGAEIVGSSRSAGKLDRMAEIGCDHTIRAEDATDLKTRVSELGPVDVTINHLGGPYTAAGMEVLRRGGVQVVCGRTAGRVVELDLRETYRNHKRLIGSTLGTQPDLERIVGLAAGDLDPVVDETYPLGGTARAFREMDASSVFGKLVVEPGR